MPNNITSIINDCYNYYNQWNEIFSSPNLDVVDVGRLIRKIKQNWPLNMAFYITIRATSFIGDNYDTIDHRKLYLYYKFLVGISSILNKAQSILTSLEDNNMQECYKLKPLLNVLQYFLYLGL